MVVKPLQPSLREKKRYVAYEVMTAKPVHPSEIARSIEKALHWLIGDLGAAHAGVQFLKYSNQTSRGVVRVTNGSQIPLQASFTLITEVEHQPALVRSVGVSGALTKALTKYVAG